MLQASGVMPVLRLMAELKRLVNEINQALTAEFAERLGERVDAATELLQTLVDHDGTRMA